MVLLKLTTSGPHPILVDATNAGVGRAMVLKVCRAVSVLQP